MKVEIITKYLKLDKHNITGNILSALIDNKYLDNLESIINLINKHGHGLLTIEQLRKTRSTGGKSQSNHFNGHCRQIALITGGSFEETRFNVKVWAVDNLGYPGKPTWNNRYIWPQSESDCSISECNILIEACHIISANNGWILREE